MYLHGDAGLLAALDTYMGRSGLVVQPAAFRGGIEVITIHHAWQRTGTVAQG